MLAIRISERCLKNIPGFRRRNIIFNYELYGQKSCWYPPTKPFPKSLSSLDFRISIISVCFLIATFVGFSLKHGFGYVKDTLLGHNSLELLEGQWITSDYGVPPITISTPKVLKRMSPEFPEDVAQQAQITMFGYGSLVEQFSVVVATSKYNLEGDNKVDLNQVVDNNMQSWENSGVQNIVVQTEKFVTPNGAEGLKTYGTGNFPVGTSKEFSKGNYIILVFNANNVVQQIILSWKEDDTYADQMVDRILNSVELVKPKE